ncbi:hypothetical protein AQ853_04550 [Burkholderia pseudomallei]|nr:hypothetical protein AQ853_04550 [Burkholderia pseudomallei]
MTSRQICRSGSLVEAFCSDSATSTPMFFASSNSMESFRYLIWVAQIIFVETMPSTPAIVV